MRKIRGVSLLEIIIAMQITALMLALLCRVLPLARRQARDIDQKLGNALTAQNIMEEHLVIPLEEWPREPIVRDGYEVALTAEPWEQDSRMTLLSVSVGSGQVESYRLETLVATP